MNYVGKIQYQRDKNRWEINAFPHVRQVIRRIWDSAKRERDHLIHVDHTPTNAVDVEWLLMRYPMEVDPHHLAVLTYTAQAQRDLEQQGLDILEGRLLLDPIPLTTPLRHYQQQAFDLFRTVGSLMLADEMGLGKTAVGVAACAWAPPAVCIVSTHNQLQWRDEIKHFAANLRVRITPKGTVSKLDPHDVLIVPYSKLAGWRDQIAGRYKTVVADEIQELRHDNTARYAAAQHIFGKAEFRLGLSGTPIYNYGGEIHSTISLIRPGVLGTKEEFNREWCKSMGNDKWLVKDPPALRSFMAQSRVFIRRKAEEVGRELPPMVKVVQQVEYDKAVMKELRGEARRLAQQVLQGKFEQRGKAAQMLNLKLRMATGVAKAPFVAEMVADQAKEGDKVVVGIWHREVIDMIGKRLRDAGVPYWQYTGSESPDAKRRSVDAFKACDRGSILLMSLRSGAGLDGLQHHCQRVVYGELDWSPQVHAQLSCRVNRDGQQHEVTEVYCVIDTGSDPLISSILGLKKEQHMALIDGGMMPDMTDAQVEEKRGVALARAVLAEG